MKEDNENRFRESIEDIEPKAGAKERMLENIKIKAAMSSDKVQTKQVQSKKSEVAFNRYIKMVLPIAACFMIAVIGIWKIVPMFGNTSTEPGFVQTPFPFVAVDSAKDFEELGIYIDAPEGSDTVNYAIIDEKTAEVCFTLDHHRYYIRASKQSGDFSGLNGKQISSDKFDSETNATLEILKSGDDTLYKLSWTDGETNFILTNIDGTSIDNIKEIYQKIK